VFSISIWQPVIDGVSISFLLFTHLFHASEHSEGAKEAKFAKKLEHKEHKDENRKRKLNQEQKDFCIRSFGSKK
jgi:hypothetical protein